MARVTYGNIISDLSGSIGGTTFQRNFSGKIARSRPNTKVNPTSALAEYQNNMSQLVSIWPSLSDAAKTAWGDLALAHTHSDQWGTTKKLNGYQWFLTCNLNSMSCNEPIKSFPQTYGPIAQPGPFVLSATSSSFTITMTPAYQFEFSNQLLYASPPLRQASLKLRKSHFKIATLHLGLTTTIEILSYYEDYFKVSWSDLFARSDCSIIVSLKALDDEAQYSSTLSRAIIKIN